MRKSDIRVGGEYTCKVSGKIVKVRIKGEHPNGGWLAVNTETGRDVRIKSPQRLRGEVPVKTSPALQSVLFRKLTPEEEEQFREHARKNDPPNMASWELYHPVCRDEWLKRGIKPLSEGQIDDKKKEA